MINLRLYRVMSDICAEMTLYLDALPGERPARSELVARTYWPEETLEDPDDLAQALYHLITEASGSDGHTVADLLRYCRP